jgi:hypothetical protein
MTSVSCFAAPGPWIIHPVVGGLTISKGPNRKSSPG